MNLLIKQEHAVFYLKDNETEEILYGGAAGGGKSALGCLWLIEMCQTYHGSRWLMGRSKLKTLKETTLNTFFELSSKLKISDQFNYNAQEHIIYWNNGSQIILKDLFLYPSDPEFDSLGSLEITGAFIDECNQLVYKAWQIVKSRIRYKLHEFGLMPKLLGSCNPAKNWTYKEFYTKAKNKTLEVYRKFIQALPTDNPHLHPSYLQSLLRLDKNSKQRLYYGNWEYDDDPATLIEQDAIVDYFQSKHLTPEGNKYLTIDVARKGKDKTVYRVWHGWVVIARYCIEKSGLDVVVKKAKEIQLKHGVSLSYTIADEDGVGGGVVDFLKCKGFVNNSKALNGENYDNLKSQCSFIMAEKIQNRECSENCEDKTVIDITGEEMEQIKEKDIDKDGRKGIISKDKIKEIIGRSPDEWDSIMMRTYFELKKPSKVRTSSYHE
jgi:PBSX family phage terminase large subunit